MYTFTLYKIKCSFYKPCIYTFEWRGVMAFMEKNIGFDYEINRVTFTSCSVSDLLKVHLLTDGFLVLTDRKYGCYDIYDIGYLASENNGDGTEEYWKLYNYIDHYLADEEKVRKALS